MTKAQSDNITGPMELDKKVRAIVKLIRPIGWAPFLFCVTFGLVDASVSNPATAIIVLTTFGPLCLGGVYTINFYFDREVDKANPMIKDLKLSTQPFSTGDITPRQGAFLLATLFALGILLAWQIGLGFTLLFLLGWVAGVLYSAPPIRLKAHPVADVVTNSVSSGFLCYAAGWSAVKAISTVPIMPAVWLTLFVSSTYMLTLIIDVDADRETGVSTTAVYFGSQKTARLSLVLLIISYAFLIFVNIQQRLGWPYLLMIALFYPLGVYGYWKLYRYTVPGKLQMLPVKARELGLRATQCSIAMILIVLVVHLTYFRA